MEMKVVPGVFDCIRRDCDYLCRTLLELPVSVSQLREVPAAERSPKPAKKDQHNRTTAQARQRYRATMNRRQREVGRLGPDSYGIALHWHGGSDCSTPPNHCHAEPPGPLCYHLSA